MKFVKRTEAVALWLQKALYIIICISMEKKNTALRTPKYLIEFLPDIFI